MPLAVLYTMLLLMLPLRHSSVAVPIGRPSTAAASVANARSRARRLRDSWW
jgi:hypothetical protein